MKGFRKRLIVTGLFLLGFNSFETLAQKIEIVLLEPNTNLPIVHAHLSYLNIKEDTFTPKVLAVSSIDGILILELETLKGDATFLISHIAYEPIILTLSLLLGEDKPLKLFMSSKVNDLGEVVVNSANTKMLFVPPGTIEVDKQTTNVSGFYVDKYEVTVKEFYEFVKATGYLTEVEKQGIRTSIIKPIASSKGFIDRFPKLKYESFKQAKRNKFKLWESSFEVILKGENNWRHDELGIERSIEDSFPVVNITKKDAESYCQFYGKRLPKINEWLLMGGKKITKGWTKEYTGGLIHLVDSSPASSLGIYGLYGNVPELLNEELVYKGKTYYSSTIPNYMNELANFNFQGILYSTKDEILKSGIKKGFRCIADDF
ncbi:MAG: hypothetical protein ACJAXX_000057 [Roseivirga sp.]|jgi:hypothetical protein